MPQSPFHWLTSTPTGSVVFVLLGLILLALVYFLPSIVGFALQAYRLDLLLTVNTLLGWTVLGWIACLVWALISSTHSHTFDEEHEEPHLSLTEGSSKWGDSFDGDRNEPHL